MLAKLLARADEPGFALRGSGCAAPAPAARLRPLRCACIGRACCHVHRRACPRPSLRGRRQDALYGCAPGLLRLASIENTVNARTPGRRCQWRCCRNVVAAPAPAPAARARARWACRTLRARPTAPMATMHQSSSPTWWCARRSPQPVLSCGGRDVRAAAGGAYQGYDRVSQGTAAPCARRATWTSW